MDTETTSSLNSKYSLYMIKTTHLSDEPKKMDRIDRDILLKQRGKIMRYWDFVKKSLAEKTMTG